MKTDGVYSSYARSLLWVALAMAVAVGLSMIVEVIFVDFVHGNPHRPQSNAIVMMLYMPPLLGVIAAICTFLVFSLPQYFQAFVTSILMRKFYRRSIFGVLLSLPLTVALAWYCYEYFTPTDFNLGINAGPDWEPYKHGITLQRYLIMFVFQTPITLFGALYYDASICNRSRKPIIICLLLFTVVLGVTYGHWMAEGQYQFL